MWVTSPGPLPHLRPRSVSARVHTDAILAPSSPSSAAAARGAPSEPQQTARWSQRKKNQAFTPLLFLFLLLLLLLSVYSIHTRALHNRVTGEIKRTALLQGCARSSPLTHILSGYNEELLLTTWRGPLRDRAGAKLVHAAFFLWRFKAGTIYRSWE